MPKKKSEEKKEVQTAIPRAKQPKKIKAVKGEEKVYIKASVIFEVSAVIPTQKYGNIQPRISVQVATIEEGRAMVMPVMEELYKQYAEKPLNGKDPVFYGKVTETVKEVAPAPMKATEALEPPTEAPAATVAVEPVPAAPKPEPVLKAEKAISHADTEAAMVVIQDQIEKSVKIPQEFKQDLLTLCLKRRKEIEGK